MTDATFIIVACIAAIPPTVAAITAGKRNGDKLDGIHLSLNSRLDQLVKASKAEGAQAERDKHTITVQGVPSSEPREGSSLSEGQ